MSNNIIIQNYYSKNQIKKYLNIKSDVTFYKYIKKEKFPKPYEIFGKPYWCKKMIKKFIDKKLKKINRQ